MQNYTLYTSFMQKGTFAEHRNKSKLNPINTHIRQILSFEWIVIRVVVVVAVVVVVELGIAEKVHTNGFGVVSRFVECFVVAKSMVG